jgi:Uncharacterized conserved protein
MRIEVSEYLSECQRTLEYCQRQREDITDIQRALVEFQSGMSESFIGKTGTAITNYFEEVVSVLLAKVEKMLADNITAMRIMETDMLELFEDGGIIDTDYMNHEYIDSFNSFSDEVSYNLDEINKLTSSISDIIDLPKLDADKPQELKYDMRREIEKVTELLIETDRRWCNLLEPIAEQMEDIKSLLATITDNEISPIDYQKGTIEFLALQGSTDFSVIKTMDDFATIQGYYEYVIARGVYEGKITEKIFDGNTYYEFNDMFYFQNYGDINEGVFIFVEGSYGLEMFVINEGNNSVSVPFGIFEPDPFKQLFNGEGWKNLGEEAPVLIHYRSEAIPEHLESKIKELNEVAKHYSKAKNSRELAQSLLRYLGNVETEGVQEAFTLYELDDIATRWSGGESWRDFAGEIEAHAEIVYGTFFAENFIKWADKNINKRFIEDTDEHDLIGYYQAGAIADLGPGDRGTRMQQFFNNFYGGIHEDKKYIYRFGGAKYKDFRHQINKKVVTEKERQSLNDIINMLKIEVLK